MVCGLGGLSGLCRGGRTFGGLGLQRQPDGSSERNVFDDSCTEEGTVAGDAIFEGRLNISVSEVRK